jgi:hypothetical protein
MSEVVVAILGVVFSAFAIWFTVRLVNRGEKWAKRTAVALVAVLVGYPLSFGPACWITSRFASLYPAFGATYRPLVWAADYTPGSWPVLARYATIGMSDNGRILVRHGNRLVIYRR